MPCKGPWCPGPALSRHWPCQCNPRAKGCRAPPRLCAMTHCAPQNCSATTTHHRWHPWRRVPKCPSQSCPMPGLLPREAPVESQGLTAFVHMPTLALAMNHQSSSVRCTSPAKASSCCGCTLLRLHLPRQPVLRLHHGQCGTAQPQPLPQEKPGGWKTAPCVTGLGHSWGTAVAGGESRCSPNHGCHAPGSSPRSLGNAGCGSLFQPA